MLGQIILNTPLWVWALLAFLIYRGIRAAGDRDIPFDRVFVIPLIMLSLSLHGIASTFDAGLALMLTWFAFMMIAGGLAWRFFDQGVIVAHPDRGAIFQRGSWTPLTVMMGIFFTKYVVAATLALHPHYAQNTGFAIGICALYGVFSGIFIGNMLRVVSIYRRTGAALRASPSDSSCDWGSQKF